jgi:pimeloyl-ACP methyl ester carboxylesterase
MTIRKLPLNSGVEIECEDLGTGDRPFVLVHGYTGSRDDWREQLPRLAEQGRVIAIDQRGHGGSTNTGDPATYSLDQMATDLGLTLDALGIDRFDLLGHSMGGMVALRFTLAQPERVASLILMDTAPAGIEMLPLPIVEATAKLVREQGMSALATIMREGARKQARGAPAALATVERMGFDAWWARITAKLEAMDPEAFATLGLALSQQTPVTDRLGEIGCPTRILVGEQDVPFRKPSEVMLAGIAGAQLDVIPDAAHSPQLENNPVWFTAVTEHLATARS